jgi:hypothetical protein
MSSPIRSDEIAKYAPRWVREGIAKPRDGVALPLAPQLPPVHGTEPPWRGPSPFEGDIRHWRTRAEPHQHVGLETPPVLVTGPAQVGMLEKVFRTAAVVSFAVIAMGALGLLLFPNAPRDAVQANGRTILAATESRAPAVSQREKYPIAKSTSRVGVPDPRPVEPAPAFVEPATKSANNGQVAQTAAPTSQVASAVYVVASAEPSIQPPPTRAQQPVAAQQVLLSQPQQPQFQQPQFQQPQVQQPQVQQPQAQQAPQPQAQPFEAAQGVTSLAPQRVRSQRILSPDELDRLLNRGEAFLAQGDVAAARLVLERAAEARDARAALTLGSTYDPNVLRRMGVVGVQPDPEQARSWYERAAEFGSGEANQRLTALAQR